MLFVRLIFGHLHRWQIKTFASFLHNHLFIFILNLLAYFTLVSLVYCTKNQVELLVRVLKAFPLPSPTAINKIIFFIAPAVSLRARWKIIYPS